MNIIITSIHYTSICIIIFVLLSISPNKWIQYIAQYQLNIFEPRNWKNKPSFSSETFKNNKHPLHPNIHSRRQTIYKNETVITIKKMIHTLSFKDIFAEVLLFKCNGKKKTISRCENCSDDNEIKSADKYKTRNRRWSW